MAATHIGQSRFVNWKYIVSPLTSLCVDQFFDLAERGQPAGEGYSSTRSTNSYSRLCSLRQFASVANIHRGTQILSVFGNIHRLITDPFQDTRAEMEVHVLLHV